MSAIDEIGAEVRDSSVFWFWTLEAARDWGDYALAAEAQHELARLGVRVAYGRPLVQKKAPPCRD